jgi:thioredoxin 1
MSAINRSFAVGPTRTYLARKVQYMASANVVELTTDNWETEVVQSSQPVLVDFWAPWCGPCRALAPTIDKLADSYAGKIKVGKLNTDDHPDVAVRYAISGIPQVLLFKGSDQPVERLVGLQPETALVKVINRVLGA